MSFDRDRLIERLKLDEGVVLHAYQDSLGWWTIGTGRLIDARKGGGISMAENDLLLSNDIDRKVNELDKHIPAWTTLDPVRQEVLLNMCFNMGIGNLQTFRNTLASVFAGKYGDAAHGMMASEWAFQVHGRAARLARAMETGNFTT